MASTTNYQEMPKLSPELSQSQRNDVVEDYEWDDSKKIETAWSLSRKETKLKRGKRSYGRRSNTITTNKVPSFAVKKKGYKSKKRGLNESKDSGTEHQRSLESSRGCLEFMDTGGPSIEYPLSFFDDEASSPSGLRHNFHRRTESLPCQQSMHERPRFGSMPSVCFPGEDINDECKSDNENCNPNLKGRDKNMQNLHPDVSSKRHHSQSYSHQSLFYSLGQENLGGSEIIVTTPLSSQHGSSLNSLERSQSPTFSAESGSSCSSLSQGGEIVQSQVKNNFSDDGMGTHQVLKSSLDYPCSPSLDPKKNISVGSQPVAIDATSSNAVMTPARSVCSSRKRCVCYSPAIEEDEITSTGGVSMGRPSTSSYGSRRARSRIFSPKKFGSLPDSTLKSQFNALGSDEFCSPLVRDGNEKNRDVTSIHDIPNKSCEEHHNGDKKSIELYISSQGKEGGSFKLPPSKPKRVSSVGGGSFADTVFAPVEDTAIKKEVEIFKSISSYRDLKYLVKELRRWSDGKRIVSFGMRNNCTIVPPNKWPFSRKKAFITWTTSQLGFCLRSGGGTVTYLHTKADKAMAVHQDLEDVLIEYKKNKDSFVVENVAEKTFEQQSVEALKEKAPFSSIKIMTNVTTTPMFHMATSITKSVTKKTIMSIERPVFSPLDNDVEENLVGKLNLLNLKIEGPETVGITKCNDNGTEMPISLLSLAATTREYSKVNKKPPRLSYDNSVMDNCDFMSHMHGVSPKYTANTENTCPSSLIIPRRKLNECQSVISPAIRSITSTALSFDGAETPMPKVGCRTWGSRPVTGKDWGQSTRCNASVLLFLQTKLEEAVLSIQSNSLRSPNSCFESASMATVIVDSDALGFDFEADTLESQEGDLGNNEECLPDGTSKNTCSRQGKESLGMSWFAALDLNGESYSPEKVQKRQQTSVAKHQRMSICASAMKSRWPLRLSVHTQAFARSNVVAGDFCQDAGNVPSTTPLDQGKITKMKNTNDVLQVTVYNEIILSNVFSFLREHEILCSASLVCTRWADAATDAHASLMLFSVGCAADFIYGHSGGTEDFLDDDASLEDAIGDMQLANNSVAQSMERSWDYLTKNFPWGNFLSEGAFKQVYKVWNTSIKAEEAVSVMNVDLISDKNIVGAELSVAVMLSSLVRRNVCPNFVLTRGVFTSKFEPSPCCWGNAKNKKPLGNAYNLSKKYKKTRQPDSKSEGNYQYIRMELCRNGDIEEYIKTQPDSVLHPEESRILLFQMAFALYVAGDRFAMKHYDVKLLNFFLQSTNQSNADQDEQSSFTVLRYGVGEHIFNLRMQTSRALIAKLADYGTANVHPESDGQPVLLSNFTTLENSPPEFMILGDKAQQGYGHDYFGLGLCMLQLFTGYAPYEEILETVTCPKNLKNKLQQIWENSNGYEVIRSVILGDVFEDEDGNIEGEPDNTLYDTFYRFIVLFGIPSEIIELKGGSRVWKAVKLCLGTQLEKTKKIRASRRNVPKVQVGLDALQFENDCKQYSFMRGDNIHISRARRSLQNMEGGVDLLLNLVTFVPSRRASALDVINSKFMAPLREEGVASSISQDDVVYSYMSYSSR